ncbi:MAG: ABC transporter permease [Candidatus Dormibacteraeota bacterium]|nr:ABC transporter permease [Candidatus Dormibacteraeota bacterium]
MADQPLKKGVPPPSEFKSMLGGTKLAGALAAEGALRQTAASEDLVVAEVAEPSEVGFWQLTVVRFLHHRAAFVSLMILVFIIVTAVVIPIFQGDLYRVQDYTHPYGAPFQFHSRAIALPAGLSVTIPWSDHLLGTDSLGSDEMARLIRGGRVSLTVGLLATVGYILIGGILGALAGYYGGWIDNALMRMTDVIIAMPFILVVIAVTAAFGGVSLNILVLVIAFLGWFEIGRLMRAQFLVLRESEFVMAARALGASDFRIIFRHIVPNSLAPIIVSATLGVSGIILLEAALGFLGLSIPLPEPSWGNMLSTYEEDVLRGTAYLIAFPAIALVTTALCINLVGDGIRDALDPRQR